MTAAPDPRRAIPSADRILSAPWCQELIGAHGRRWVARQLGSLLAEMRSSLTPIPTDDDALAALLGRRIAAAATPSLRPVVNATGVVLHTNLGRAPLAEEARRAMAAAAGYGNVEFDLDTGRRGSRHQHCTRRVCELVGAEDAVVVNNNAAAVALALTAFAQGRGVAVSHGELVEIGGGFRIPEVIEAAGAEMMAVGTTNRTRITDYERAIEAGAAAILKVHRSNFAMSGFTEEAALADLVALGASHGVPVIHDLGSGLLVPPDEVGLPPEATPAESVAAGVDLVAFSGDKLLGGPQAGVLAGKKSAVRRAKSHPLCRAIRCDKVTLAGLEATLSLYGDTPRASERIPALRMIRTPQREIKRRARAVVDGVDGLGARVAAGNSLVGGGTFPDARIPTSLITLAAGDDAERWMARLRAHEPPVIARTARGRVILDLRTVEPGEDQVVRAALLALAAGAGG